MPAADPAGVPGGIPSWAETEKLVLAGYAVVCAASRGRVHSEPEHSYRSCFQRDRERVIHSTAFRRLEYKTQVFVNHEGDYYRTRLTHTTEVAQIARSIARALRLNEDLTEAVALAHDIGHTPFGHSGEDALQELMRDHGGFEHNVQGLRVVDFLEKRYPEFEGLNLTWEVREGIAKHTTFHDSPRVDDFDPACPPLLEAQVVEVADEIAYTSHDLDDGMTAGLLEEGALAGVSLWKEAASKADRRYPGLDPERRKYAAVRNLIDWQVTDLLKETRGRIAGRGISSAEEARRQPGRLVAFSPEMKELNAGMKEFLTGHLYDHYRVVRMSDKAHRFIKQLFEAYLNRPEQLPPGTQKRVKEDDPHRAICDYVAGMTDRFALGEHRKLFGYD